MAPQPLRTLPTPGMHVQVEFPAPRSLDVLVDSERDSVAFDRVKYVRGVIVRTSPDSIWLRDVAVDAGGKLVRPRPDPTLRVENFGRGIDVREVRLSDDRSAALAVGIVTAGALLWFVSFVRSIHGRFD